MNDQVQMTNAQEASSRSSPISHWSLGICHSLVITARRRFFTFLIYLATPALCSAQPTNLLSVPSPLPEMGFSVVRVFGSMIVVLALFLGGVWLFKNWQRVAIYKGRTPKLNILEVKSLGNRHALYLVAYEQQRLLVSSSPGGINLLTHLP